VLTPLIAGMTAAPAHLLEWAQAQGMVALQEVFAAEAEALAGPQGKHQETLTVLKLELPARRRRFFATTNCIENLIGFVRHVTRNVKRGRDGTMSISPQLPSFGPSPRVLIDR